MKANKSGQAAENVLAAALTTLGVVFERQVVIGRSIYDRELRADFVALNIAAYPNGLAIESKWQDVGGSIDEKFPYVVMNIQRCYPIPAIVVVHGGGCCSGALAYLEAECDGRKLVAVHSLESFMSWALRAEKVAVPELFR